MCPRGVRERHGREGAMERFGGVGMYGHGDQDLSQRPLPFPALSRLPADSSCHGKCQRWPAYKRLPFHFQLSLRLASKRLLDILLSTFILLGEGWRGEGGWRMRESGRWVEGASARCATLSSLQAGLKLSFCS